MTTLTEPLSVVTPANHIPGPPQGQWTYADYAALPADGLRYEIINGVLYMSPAPNRLHQKAVGWFFFYLVTHVQLTQRGEVYVAPFDVELTPEDVPQPDVIVVLQANLSILTDKGIVGAPDLIIEVASPSTAGYDRRDKQDTYARTGVREYWIADPAAQTVEVLVLHAAAYRSLGVFTGAALLPSQVVPNLPVRVAQFFA